MDLRSNLVYIIRLLQTSVKGKFLNLALKSNEMEKVDLILKEYKNACHDSLIPILQEIQEAEGFLSETAIVEVGNHLHLPTSKIYGVATFYNQFRFQPKGKYNIQVCRDNLFSIEVVACIGACGLAPVIAINGEFHAKVTVDSLKEIVESYRNREELS